MIIIKNKILPFGGYSTFNLFGILFTKRKRPLDNVEINHESIHSQQILELGVIGFFALFLLSMIFNFSLWWLLLAPCTFYIWYEIEYLIVRFFHKKQNDAYHDISFEEEAYNNEDNLQYLIDRERFNWIQYLKVKSYVGKQR